MYQLPSAGRETLAGKSPSSQIVDLIEHHFLALDRLLVIRAAPSLDTLVAAESDADRLPYWAVLWPTAEQLARRLLTERSWAGVEVLELGCGLGLTGLALAAAGARVTQTDLFPEAVALAQANAAANGLHGLHYAAADWRAWPLRRRWPVIVASDVTYERAAHPALLQVLTAALAPGGTAYLADPGRPMSLDFFAGAEQEGWQVDLEPLEPGSFLYRLERKRRGF